MIAWALLTENSSLTTGTAWEHLNNQIGGSGSSTFLPPMFNVSLSEDKNKASQVEDPSFNITNTSNNVTVGVNNQYPIKVTVTEL